MPRKKPYLPTTYAAILAWFLNFVNKLQIYATSLNFGPAEVTAVENDYTAFAHAEQIENASQANAQDATRYKLELLKGDPDNPVIDPPTPGTYPTLTTPVKPGILSRISQTVKRIKIHPYYIANPNIGEAMQIIGAETTVDYDTMQTELKLKANLNNGIKIKYLKKGMDGAVIYGQVLKTYVPIDGGSINEADWKIVGKVTGTEFHDTRLNQSRQPEARIYKAYLMNDDKIIGIASNTLRVVAEVYIDQQGNELSSVPK